jgi:hypothetical protein
MQTDGRMNGYRLKRLTRIRLTVLPDSIHSSMPKIFMVGKHINSRICWLSEPFGQVPLYHLMSLNINMFFGLFAFGIWFD